MVKPLMDDNYDPQLHGLPEQTSPAPQRWLAVLVVLAVVCAIVMVFGGMPTLPAFRP